LAIEQRSAEVWAVLGAVKTEFGKFGEALAHTKQEARRSEQQHQQGGNADAPAVAQAEGGRGAAGGRVGTIDRGGGFRWRRRVNWKHAYRATTYRVFLPGGICELRLGQACDALAEWLEGPVVMPLPL
jgi:hypothetical protein